MVNKFTSRERNSPFLFHPHRLRLLSQKIFCPSRSNSTFKTKNFLMVDMKLHRIFCTTFHRYQIFSTRYSVMCKIYTGYCGTSEIEHGLCACTVDNPLAKARGLSLRTGAQPMLYLPNVILPILANYNYFFICIGC